MNEKMYMIVITIYISNDIAKSESDMRMKRFAMKELHYISIIPMHCMLNVLNYTTQFYYHHIILYFPLLYHHHCHHCHHHHKISYIISSLNYCGY